MKKTNLIKTLIFAGGATLAMQAEAQSAKTGVISNVDTKSRLIEITDIRTQEKRTAFYNQSQIKVGDVISFKEKAKVISVYQVNTIAGIVRTKSFHS